MSPFLPPKFMQGVISRDENWFKTNYCLVITYDALLGRVTKPTWSTSNRRLFPNLKKGYFQMKQTFISKCEILWYFDTIRPSFLSFKTNICKPSSWCQRYFQAGGTAHPTGGWILPEFCSHPHCPVFLTFALTPGCLLSSSQCSSNPHISAIKTPQHSGLMLWKKEIFSLTVKWSPWTKPLIVLWQEGDLPWIFRKASLLLCSGGIWTIAGLKRDSSLQASKFGGGPRMLTKEGSYHQLLCNYRSACSPSQILQTFWKETGDIWTCKLQRTV